MTYSRPDYSLNSNSLIETTFPSILHAILIVQAVQEEQEGDLQVSSCSWVTCSCDSLPCRCVSHVPPCRCKPYDCGCHSHKPPCRCNYHSGCS